MKEKCGYKDFSYWNGLEKGIELGADWQKEQDQSTIELVGLFPQRSRLGLQRRNQTVDKTGGKPLTEFEKTFKKLLECYASAMGTPVVEQPIESTMGFIKKHGSPLLDIARNEVIKDMDNMTRYGVMAINQTSFTLGYGLAVDNIRKYMADHIQKNTEASSGRADSGIEHFADGLIKRMQEIGPYGEPV